MEAPPDPDRSPPSLAGSAPRPLGAGLVLGGCGVAGAMFELGCIAALQDELPGVAFNALDLYVGTGGGATLAAMLAGGLPVARIYRAMLDPSDDFFPLQRKHVVRFDGTEWRRLLASAATALRRAAGSVLARPTEFDLWRELDRFYDSLPAGVLDLLPYEGFLDEFFARRGVPASFEAMPRPLWIPAYDLDTAERVVFGRGAMRHVPVSRAVCASSAVPIFYAPVHVGERDFIAGEPGEGLHLDLVAREGLGVVVAINPMVPVRNDPATLRIPTGHGTMPRVRDKGLMWVYNQAHRIGVRARVEAEMARARADAEGPRVLLLAPREDDATMFMHSPMNFAARRTVLRHGYDTTTAALRREGDWVREALSSAAPRP